MRLALAMGCSIRELFERFGNELKWWVAYDTLEPIGEIRGDFRIGQLCAMVAAFGGKEQRPKDFMPFLEHGEQPVQRQSDEEMIAILRQSGIGVS
jgi:hypothetical protein